MGFTRKKEDFVCEKCGARVTGNGYTNHCPRCLWSRHVDVSPGDRASPCGGMMRPAGVLQKKGEWFISHQCVSCGFRRLQGAGPDDNFDALVRLVSGV